MKTMNLFTAKKALSRLPLLLAGFVLFSFGHFAAAQGLAHINGTVTDKNGAAVPGAKVVATQTGTGVTTEAVTNGSGAFVFPSLPPSNYEVSVSSTGFSTYVQKGILLQADQTQTVNAMLQVGSTTDSVVVTMDAPQVDTTTGTLSQVIGERQVNEMPLNGRNAAALTTLVAGVVTAPNAGSDQGVTKSFPVVVTISSNGTRANQSSYLLDGGNNVDEYTNVNAPFPMPDALQEFSVETSNYSAEYGQNAGAVVNIITKSGTNKYHGDLFEYVRNRVFNARNYFQTTVDPLKRNQFGGTIGGPVGIPGLWKASDKAFFFFGVQKTFYRTQNSPSSTTVPTTQNIVNGVLPELANTSTGITNPFTGTFYAQTQPGSSPSKPGYATVNTADFNPVSVALLHHVAVANSSSPDPASLNFIRPASENFLEYTGRFDQNIGAKDRYALRYFYDTFANQGVLDLTNLPTYADGSNITYQNALISETHTFTDALLNNFILSYQREYSTRGPLPGGINMNDLGATIWQPDFKSIQQISTGYFSIGDNPHATFLRNNITLSDDVHWTKGSHSLSMGFHFEISKVDVVNENGQPGTFAFANDSVSNPHGNTAFVNFLFGYLNAFTQNSGQFQQNRAKYYGAYVQDSWKVNRRLTLNYGLRYEPYLPLHERGNRLGQFNPGNYASGTRSVLHPNAPPGLLFAGDPGMPIDGIRPVYANFMPRVGFALDVFGDGRTSLRGGGGMFYDTRSNGLFNNGWIGSSPFTTSVSLSPAGTPFNNPYNTGNPGATLNPFPAPYPPTNPQFIGTLAPITFDPSGNYQVPLNYAWNLAIEQQVTNKLSTRIAYVGGHGSHIFTSPDINPAVYAPGATVANTNSRRIYNGSFLSTTPSGTNTVNYGSIALTNMGGNSSFHSLQATVQQRLAYGLSATLNYTWSRSLDNIPNGAAVTSAGGGQSYIIPVNMPNYKRLDYGPSDFDRTNVITATYVWQFPKFTHGYAAVRYVINGWQTSGLIKSQSGDRINVALGIDQSLTGLNRDVPVQVGSGYGKTACAGVATPCKSWLASSGFAVPAVGTFGNVKKNTFIGPRYTDWDMSIMRKFGFGHFGDLQFRAEYFNVLNHTNFSDPSTGSPTSSATFGRITNASDPRIAQLSLKYAF